MTHRFGEFELDLTKRELRLAGREILVQPKVFDLLAHFVQNPDRLLSKDELFDAVWPGVVVSEGVLHRAISLARSVLREGGMENALRTYARKGYRFLETVEPVSKPNAVPDESDSHAEIKHAFELGRWEDAIEGFEQADKTSPLSAPNLERWAYAAQCAAKIPEALAPLERAVVEYSKLSDKYGAARCALELARILWDRRETSVAKGWLARAQSFLESLDETREHGLSEWLTCRIELETGEFESAEAHGRKAMEIGRRLEDTELESLALVYLGFIEMAKGNVDRGIDQQNEAAAAVLGGAVGPLAGGMVYCNVIWSCRDQCDWQRAHEWTEQFTSWCARSGIDTYPSICRLHRAEVLGLKGDLFRAEYEIDGACRQLPSTAPWAVGDAYRVLGDLKLMKHDLAGAEEAFRMCHVHGWDPQPGYALLQFELGKQNDALDSLRQALAQKSWTNLQRRRLLLARFAALAARCGKLDEANAAITELYAQPQSSMPSALKALSQIAAAELAYVSGNLTDALESLREAIHLYRDIGSPLYRADAQVRLGEWLIGCDRKNDAELEFSAAESVFREYDVEGRANACAAKRQELATRPSS